MELAATASRAQEFTIDRKWKEAVAYFTSILLDQLSQIPDLGNEKHITLVNQSGNMTVRISGK